MTKSTCQTIAPNPKVQRMYDNAVDSWYKAPESDSSMAVLQHAVDYFEEIDLKNDSIRGRCLLLLSLNWVHDDRKKPIELLKRALHHYRQIYDCRHTRLHSAYFHLAEKSFVGGHLEQARLYCDTLLQCQVEGQQKYQWARALGLKGRIEARLGKAYRSELFFQAAYPYANAQDSLDLLLSQVVAFTDVSRPERVLDLVARHESKFTKFYLAAAKVQSFIALEQPDSCLYYLADQLAHSKGVNQLALNAVYRNLAGSYAMKNNYVQAEKALLKMDKGHFTQSDSMYYSSDLAEAKFGQRNLQLALTLDQATTSWYLQDTTSHLFAMIYFTSQSIDRLTRVWQKDGNISHLEQALAWSNRCDQLIRKHRLQDQSTSDRQRLSTQTKTLYDHAIKAADYAFEATGDEKYAMQALSFIEANKANVLQEELLARHLQADSLQLEPKIKDLYAELIKSEDVSKARELSDRLMNIILSSTEKMVLFYRNFETSSIQQQIAKLENRDEQYLHFYQHLDSTLTMIVHRPGFINLRHYSAADWVEDVTNHLTSIKTVAEDRIGFAKLGEWMTNDLAPEIPVTVVPDGILHSYPMEIVPSIDGVSFIDRWSFNYIPSLGSRNAQQLTTYQTRNLYAVAPTFTGGAWSDLAYHETYTRSGMAPLRYNIEEATKVAETFSIGSAWVDSAATKSDFLENAAEEGAIWHFATHAFANQEETIEPHILFSGQGAEERLSLSEIYELKIPAGMVVMSACETGIGAYVEGEGVMSLARGFTYAGAKSVVASLWPVNDKSTSEIMTTFHNYLKDGMRKDDALRLAKRDYINAAGPQERHPFYWAGFIAMGDMSPLDFGGSLRWLYWLCTVGVMLLLLRIYLTASRQRSKPMH